MRKEKKKRRRPYYISREEINITHTENSSIPTNKQTNKQINKNKRSKPNQTKKNINVLYTVYTVYLN